MPAFEILCLAISRKYNEKCIAGLRTNGDGWIRPVSSKNGGALSLSNYELDNLSVPQIFDIIGIEFEEHCPLINQPENWLISKRKWNLISRPSPPESIERLLEGRLNQETYLFGNSSDRVDYDFLCANPPRESLTLIRPQNLHWNIQVDSTTGKRKNRAVFIYNNVTYSLVITDTQWEEKLTHLSPGFHAANTLNLDNYDPEQLLFTVSLGAEFKGDCYKLVAAVIQLNLFGITYA